MRARSFVLSMAAVAAVACGPAPSDDTTPTTDTAIADTGSDTAADTGTDTGGGPPDWPELTRVGTTAEGEAAIDGDGCLAFGEAGGTVFFDGRTAAATESFEVAVELDYDAGNPFLYVHAFATARGTDPLQPAAGLTCAITGGAAVSTVYVTEWSADNPSQGESTSRTFNPGATTGVVEAAFSCELSRSGDAQMTLTEPASASLTHTPVAPDFGEAVGVGGRNARVCGFTGL